MFGSHLSIAGDMTNALVEAERLGMDTVQVFTKNQQQWKVPPLDPGLVKRWRGEVDRLGWNGRLVAHASYLINLASPNDELWEKSIALMRVEIERCHELGISFLVHHPGSTTGGEASAGVARIAAAYVTLFKATRGCAVVACLENTVGAGSTLGGRFEQLGELRAAIADATGQAERVGFCFDTCHAHAAGHDMSTRAAAAATLSAFDRACGMNNLRVLHMNDSKGALGSKRDLHQHIGLGEIGKGGLAGSGFAEVCARSAFVGVPKILETPKGEDASGIPNDSLNLGKLRELAPGSRPIDSGPVDADRPRRGASSKPSATRQGKVSARSKSKDASAPSASRASATRRRT